MFKSDIPSSFHHEWYQWSSMIEQRLLQQQQTIELLQQEIAVLKAQIVQQEAAKVFHVEKIEYHFDQLKVDTLEGSLQIGLSTSNPQQLPMMIEDIAMKQQAEQPLGNSSYMNHPYSKNVKNQPTSASLADMMHKGNQGNPNLYNRLHPKHQSAAPDQNQNNENDDSKANNQTSKSSFTDYEPYIEQALTKTHTILDKKLPSYIHRQFSLFKQTLTEEHMRLIVDDIKRQLPARIHYYIHEKREKNVSLEPKIWIDETIAQTLNDIEQAIDQYVYQLSEQEKET